MKSLSLDTVLGDALGPMSETSPLDSRVCVVAANDSMDSLTEALSNCQEQLRLAEQQLDERCEPLKEVPSETFTILASPCSSVS